MTHLWQHLVAAGLLRDLLGIAVAHLAAVPHFIIWQVRKRRKRAQQADGSGK